MKKIHPLAAVALIALTVVPQAFAQSTPAAQAARLQRLQQQQAAVLARVKAAQAQAAGTAAPTAVPTTAPTPVVAIPRPIPTAAPTVAPTVAPTAVTAAPTATVAPKTTASAATSAAPATSGSAAPVVAVAHPDTTAIALDIEALRKSRPERRHAEFTNMQARWGGLLSDARTNDELKLHAQRLAYLQRIRALGAKDPTFVTSVDALITKEETRDSDALNALRSGALPTAAPAAAAPAAAAPAAGAAK